MKILFIINSLSYMGGAEKVLSMITNYFASKKYTVSILTLKEPKSIFDLHPNIKLIESPVINMQSSPLKTILLFTKQIKNIRQTIKEEKPSIIISFMAPTNIMSIIASFFLKIPIIVSEHTHFHRAVKNKFWSLLRRIVYPFANRILVLTETDKLNYTFTKNVSVMPNPLILENKYHNIKRENIILGVGRIHHVKGFDMLIEAFSRLNLKDWKLIIAGDRSSDYYKKLQTQVDNLNSTNIQFVGLIKDIELYYKKASIYVLSSRAEGFPGTLCEAMGYGCPSIAFNCKTGPSEIIRDNIDGLLVNANDVDELSEKILYLIENKEKRELFNKNSPLIIKRLDIQSIGKKWEKIIKTNIKGNNL